MIGSYSQARGSLVQLVENCGENCLNGLNDVETE